MGGLQRGHQPQRLGAGLLRIFQAAQALVEHRNERVQFGKGLGAAPDEVLAELHDQAALRHGLAGRHVADPVVRQVGTEEGEIAG